MEYECLCGDRCKLCKSCELPECECMCINKKKDEEDDFEEDFKDNDENEEMY